MDAETMKALSTLAEAIPDEDAPEILDALRRRWGNPAPFIDDHESPDGLKMNNHFLI